jgi:hypothetical protein
VVHFFLSRTLLTNFRLVAFLFAVFLSLSFSSLYSSLLSFVFFIALIFTADLLLVGVCS